MNGKKENSLKSVREAVIEIALEVALSVAFLGIGALVASLFGVRIDFESADPDTVMLLGAAAVFAAVCVLTAILHLIKKFIG